MGILRSVTISSKIRFFFGCLFSKGFESGGNTKFFLRKPKFQRITRDSYYTVFLYYTVSATLIIAGGLAGTSYSNFVDIWNSATNTWSSTTLSVPRSLMAGTSVQPYAFFAGGQTGASSYSNVVDVWNECTLSVVADNPCCSLTLSVPTNFVH
jgi:hypothetical protein